MLIDVILDRKDGGQVYSAADFYRNARDYDWPGVCDAMDYGSNKSVRYALKSYIDNNGYSPDIKDYIDSVCWLSDDDHIELTPAVDNIECKYGDVFKKGCAYKVEIIRNGCYFIRTSRDHIHHGFSADEIVRWFNVTHYDGIKYQ